MGTVKHHCIIEVDIHPTEPLPHHTVPQMITHPIAYVVKAKVKSPGLTFSQSTASNAARPDRAQSIWKALLAVATRSTILEHSLQPHGISWESIFGEGGKPKFPEENPKVRLRST